MQVWNSCADGATVHLYTITGGGHTWPGGTSNDKWGESSKDLNASQVIWDTLNTSAEPAQPTNATAKSQLMWHWSPNFIPTPNRRTPRIYGVPYCKSEHPKSCDTQGASCFVWSNLWWNNSDWQLEYAQYHCRAD